MWFACAPSLEEAQCRVASMMSIFGEKMTCPLTPITMCLDEVMQHRNTEKLRWCGKFLNPIIIPLAGTNPSSHGSANGSHFKKTQFSLFFFTNRRGLAAFNNPQVANWTAFLPWLGKKIVIFRSILW